MIEKVLAGAAPVVTPIPAASGSGGIIPVNAVNNLYTYISGLLAIIAGSAAILYLIWYGIQYISSGGSPEKAKAARQAIINAIIGIVVVVGAYSIIRLGTTIANTINTTVRITPTPSPVPPHP